MKKSKIGIIIVALVMIIAGLGLFVGGVMAVGGVSAAKDAMFHHGVDIEDVLEQELEEDGFDIDLDIDF